MGQSLKQTIHAFANDSPVAGESGMLLIGNVLLQSNHK